jgi:hypothetical protein
MRTMARERSIGLTPRQQEWRRHLEACARSGETMRGYAKRLELSESAMYQAAKDLRRHGVLPQSARSRSEAKKPSFVKVSAAVHGTSSGAWRARLPNGIVLEGSEGLGPKLLEALAAL